MEKKLYRGVLFVVKVPNSSTTNVTNKKTGNNFRYFGILYLTTIKIEAIKLIKIA
jgi:hypothetical protein